MSYADKPPTGLLNRKFASQDESGMRYRWVDQELILIRYDQGERIIIDRFKVQPGYYTIEPVDLTPITKPRARL